MCHLTGHHRSPTVPVGPTVGTNLCPTHQCPLLPRAMPGIGAPRSQCLDANLCPVGVAEHIGGRVHDHLERRLDQREAAPVVPVEDGS